MEELSNVLWVYRKTSRNAIGKTLYSLSFGVKVVVPVEVGAPSHRTQHFLLNNNETNLRAKLNLLGEGRDQARIRVVVYQQR